MSDLRLLRMSSFLVDYPIASRLYPGSLDTIRHLRTVGLPVAEAVALFCYEAKKWIGSFAAALGGLDTLVFAGGLGENAPRIRERICAGLDFLGVVLDPARNAANEPMISSSSGRVAVRVIRTDEEFMIARSVMDVLALGALRET